MSQVVSKVIILGTKAFRVTEEKIDISQMTVPEIEDFHSNHSGIYNSLSEEGESYLFLQKYEGQEVSGHLRCRSLFCSRISHHNSILCEFREAAASNGRSESLQVSCR